MILLSDLALDIDPGRDCLGILAWHMRQEPLEVEVHGVRVDLDRLLIGQDKLAQTLHHLMEDVGGDEAIAQQFLSPLCPHGCHLFASSNCPAKRGRSLEAIVITVCYMIKPGSKEEIQ
jgi:hypothetical protein